MPTIVMPPQNTLTPETQNFHTQILQMIKQGRQVFGSPGASLTWGIPEDEKADPNNYEAVPVTDQVQAGIDGETATAQKLDQWVTKHPTAMVVHSLAWAGGGNGDTDHILLLGNTLIIIDSKKWMQKRQYSFNKEGAIRRGKVTFPEGKVKMIPAMKMWEKCFKDLNQKVHVRGLICIAQKDIHVLIDENWKKSMFKLTTIDNLPNYLDIIWDRLSATDKDTVNIGILEQLIKSMIKPRNRRAEIINTKNM